MIQIHLDRTSPPGKRGLDRVQIYGNTETLVLEICIALASIYQSMMDKDPAGAMQFRLTVAEMLKANSSTWDSTIQKTTIWGVNKPTLGKE